MWINLRGSLAVRDQAFRQTLQRFLVKVLAMLFVGFDLTDGNGPRAGQSLGRVHRLRAQTLWYPIHTFPREWLAPIAADLAAGREQVVYGYVARCLRRLPRQCLFPPPF